jgi:hypothetical protein
MAIFKVNLSRLHLAFRIPFVGRITAVVDTIEVGTEGYDHEVDMADDAINLIVLKILSGDSCWDHH